MTSGIIYGYGSIEITMVFVIPVNLDQFIDTEYSKFGCPGPTIMFRTTAVMFTPNAETTCVA